MKRKLLTLLLAAGTALTLGAALGRALVNYRLTLTGPTGAQLHAVSYNWAPLPRDSITVRLDSAGTQQMIGLLRRPAPPPPPLPVPTTVAVISGAGQSAPAASMLPARLILRLLDQDGLPYIGAGVIWSPDNGGAVDTIASTATDAQGYASAGWRLGAFVGTQTMLVRLGPLSTMITATATQPPPPPPPPRVNEVIALTAGGGQTAAAGAVLPVRIQVLVDDTLGHPLANDTIRWSVIEGIVSGNLRTGEFGYASASWTLGPTIGTQQLRVSGQRGAELVVTATATGTLPGAPASLKILNSGDTLKTSMSVLQLRAEVRDSVGNALPGLLLQWISLDPAIATVNAQGIITRASPGGGTARIVATYTFGNLPLPDGAQWARR